MAKETVPVAIPEEMEVVVAGIEAVPEIQREWKPVTSLGKLVKEGKIKDIEEIFAQGHKILEAEITNQLLPNLQEDLLLIGQAKGKFGGGQRRIFRQTQKKTQEGNKVKFTTYALVGNRDGYVGVGVGKSKETVPSRDKAKRTARLNILRVRRGCGSWQCNCHTPHSIPFTIRGKCGSSEIELRPAPKGKGLCTDKEVAKILGMAGVKDVWSKTFGQTKTKINLIGATIDALKQLSRMKVQPNDIPRLGIVDGKDGKARPEEVLEVHGSAKQDVGKDVVGKDVAKHMSKDPTMTQDVTITKDLTMTKNIKKEAAKDTNKNNAQEITTTETAQEIIVPVGAP